MRKFPLPPMCPCRCPYMPSAPLRPLSASRDMSQRHPGGVAPLLTTTTTPPHHHATMTPSHQRVNAPLLPPCPICEEHGTYVLPSRASPYTSPTLTPALPKCRPPVLLPTCLSAHVPTHSHTSRPQPTRPGPNLRILAPAHAFPAPTHALRPPVTPPILHGPHTHDLARPGPPLTWLGPPPRIYRRSA